jgi:SAM-dependent methyltransferase
MASRGAGAGAQPPNTSSNISTTARAPHKAVADEEKEEDDMPALGDFFICRDYVTKVFRVGHGESATEQPLDCLAAASTDFDLTGQIVWPVARLTSWYIAHVGPREFPGEAVLELGAGAGILGFLTSKWARESWLTDNEPEVLDLLRRNLPHAAPGCDTRIFDLSWAKDEDHAKLAEASGRKRWRKLTGADIVYWSHAIPLLADSVARLLAPDGVFILGYFDRVASNKATLEGLLSDKGLQWEEVDHATYLPDPVPAEFADFLGKMTIYRFTWREGCAPQE